MSSMADLSKPKAATKPVTTKSLPYGVTQEEWDATANLREHYHKLMVLQDAHNQAEHPWNSWCLCRSMAQAQEMQAYVMSRIKMYLLKVNYVDALVARQEAARTIAEIDAQMFSPEAMYRILTEGIDLLKNSPDTNKKQAEAPSMPAQNKDGGNT